jgi:spermidine/putrescine transport system substrate-binding protein
MNDWTDLDVGRQLDRPISRRKLIKGGMGFALAAGGLGILSACGSSSSGGGTSAAAAPTVKLEPDGDITWFTWAEYVEPKIVKAFEKEYGVKVKQAFFNSDEAMVQKLAAGLPYDLVTTNSAYIERLVEGGAVQSFDFGDLKYRDQLTSYFQHPIYDKGKYRYTVPYGYSPAGIAYQKDKLGGATPTSWNDFWELKEQASGHMYLLSQIEETIGIALVREGHNASSDNPEEVKTAVDELIALKPDLAAVSDENITDLAGGEAWLLHGWAGTVYQGLLQVKEPENYGFVLPSEGVLIGVDTLSIGANAKAPGTALLFMDWILRPEFSAANTEWQGQIVGTKASQPAFDSLTKEFPFLQFDESILTTGQWKQSLTGSRQQLWNREWSRFMAS